jgi:hypothetical protein
MATKKRGSGKREMIEPNDKRFVRRDASGQFTSDQTNVGRSLGEDVRKRAKTEVKSGHGDQGDRKRSSTSKKRGSTTRASKRS